MAEFYKPQSPLEMDGKYVYPLTTEDQVIMEDGTRLNAKIKELKKEIDEVDLSPYAKTAELPTNTSDLKNDSGFLTSIPSEYVTESELIQKGYLTSLPAHMHDKSQITDFPSSLPASDVHDWAKASSKPKYTASEVGALPSTTTIPTKTSQLENDSGYITETEIPKGPTVDTALSTTSTNAVQNKVVATALNEKANSSHSHTAKTALTINGASGTGYTSTVSINKSKVNDDLGLVCINAQIKVVVSAQIEAGATVNLGTIASYKPPVNSAISIWQNSTQARRFMGYVGTDGTIAMKSSTTLPAATYYFYITCTYMTS